MEKLIKEFKNKYCHPICGPQCKFLHKKVIIEPIKPLLYRQTHKKCSKCNELTISDYEHKFCHCCATLDDKKEFEYHHQTCKK